MAGGVDKGELVGVVNGGKLGLVAAICLCVFKDFMRDKYGA
jgi:hypothetical protein